MIIQDRMAARIDGDFVLFLIGMRINKPWMVHKWLTSGQAMGRMLKELYAHPELGLMHHESWIGRTVLLVQYWRSLDQLLAYAKDRDAAHLPAWADFYRRIGTDGTLGIWHETYQVHAGQSEAIYVNMPAFGLGKAGHLVPATGLKRGAAGRLGRTEPPQPEPVTYEQVR